MAKRKVSLEEQIIGGIAKAIWAVVSLPWTIKRIRNKKPNSANGFAIDYQYYSSRWMQIKSLSETAGASNFKQALMEADKLMDQALKNKGVFGETMGERLKNCDRIMQNGTLDNVWRAHKLRNRLAHEMDAEVMSWEVKEALGDFERGLREVGVLRN